MASSDVMISEFVNFEDDVEAAVLTGRQVESCIRNFDTSSEYMARADYEKALSEEFGFGQNIERASKILMDLFAVVEEIELSVRVVVASKSGALALRRYTGEIDDSVIKTISALDNNNVIFVGNANTVSVV